jgi:hypothetical protein
MARSVRGLNSYRDDVNGIPKNLFEFSAKTKEIADSAIDSLLASNDLAPSQWAGMLRRRVENRELHLLWGVLFCAWEDLASPHARIRPEATRFFTFADAGAPVSLRLLCEAFELDLRAVQAMARARIAAGAQTGGARRRLNASRPRYVSSSRKAIADRTKDSGGAGVQVFKAHDAPPGRA